MPRRTGVIAAVLLALTLAFAQEANELERQFSEVAGRAAAATLLVTSTAEDSSLKTCGSGAVISADGLILTCSHVVPYKNNIEVVLSDGRTCSAKLLGQNFTNDFALLKVEAEDLPHFEMGDSGSLKKDEPVMALGFPGGPNKENKPRFAYGKIVGLKRNVPVDGFQRYYADSIKTNIRSRPGNSGGPLVTKDGKLVGINGAIIVFVDRTYAIPIDAVKKALPTLKKGKDVAGTPMKDFSDLLKELGDELTPEEMKKFYEEVRKFFEGADAGGIWGQYRKLFGENIDPDKIFEQLKKLLEGSHSEFGKIMEELLGKSGFEQLRKEMEKLFEEKKAFEELARQVEKWVKEIERLFGEEEPAKKDGGDREQPGPGGLDGEIDRMFEELRKMFGREEKTADELEDVRNKVNRLLDELLGKTPEGKTPAGKPYVGVRLGGLPDALREQLDLKHGLLVERVEAGSPAQRAGLVPGDVVLRADGKDVGGIEDFSAVLEGKKAGDTVDLAVLAGGKEAEVKLKLGAR